MSGKKGLRIRGWYGLAALVLFTAIGLTASGAFAGRLTDIYNPAQSAADSGAGASNSVEGVKASRPMTGSASLVISQQYGGGGNSGATWRSDFVEIFNPTSSAVSVSGWSVQYASAAGSFTVSNQRERRCLSPFTVRSAKRESGMRACLKRYSRIDCLV